MANTCYAVVDPIFQPATRNITAITNSNPLSVTTSFAHQYANNIIVRLDLPSPVGMRQANQMFAPITVTGATTFTMPIDSTNFNPFAIPANANPNLNTCAYCVPIGETNDSIANATQNTL